LNIGIASGRDGSMELNRVLVAVILAALQAWSHSLTVDGIYTRICRCTRVKYADLVQLRLKLRGERIGSGCTVGSGNLTNCLLFHSKIFA
jgi:hypothetical protein